MKKRFFDCIIHRFINCVFSTVMRTSFYPCRVSVLCAVCCVLGVGCCDALVIKKIGHSSTLKFFTFSVAGCAGMVTCSNCFNCFNMFSPAPVPLTQLAVEPAAAGSMSHFNRIDSLLATVKNGSIKPLSSKYLLRLAQEWRVLLCGAWF